jgi:RNA polymerase sigma-70 factor (ECF subfamily)
VDLFKDIISGCLKGDRKCQEQLYKMFSGRMFGLCLQYADNYDDACDILQDGFIKVFRKLDQYSGKGSFEGWIRRIMINTALERYRSQMHLYPLSEWDEKENSPAFEDVLERLSAEELVKMVQELPPRYRMVFNMYAIEGFTHKEIAEALGIEVGTSKSNLSRARDILQRKIRKTREPDDQFRKDG